jgi:hypothetical protein
VASIKTLDIKVKNNKNIITPLLVLPLVLVTIMGATILLPFQSLNAQNATVQIENATQVENVTTTDQVGSGVLQTLAQPGFGNVYNVIDAEGNTVPISYNIIGGTLVGILGDPQRHALYVIINPGSDGGALEIDLPRNVLDSKDSGGNDSDFVVSIDGERISGEPTGICIGECPNIFNSFKETETTGTDRVLTIIFGSDNKLIEIVGNQGVLF